MRQAAAALDARPAAPSATALPERPRDGLLIVYLLYVFSGGLEQALVGPGGGGPLNQLITVSLLAGAGLAYLSRRRLPLETLKAAAPLAVVMALVLASVAWSDATGDTLRRGVRFAMEAAALTLLAHCYGRVATFWRMVWLAFALILVADYLALAFPELSATRLGYAGIHGHKNGLGGFAVAALPVFVIGALSREIRIGPRWISAGLAAALLAMLVISQSKTAWVLAPAGLIIGAVAFMAAQRRGGPLLALAAAALAFGLLAAIPLVGEETLGQLVGVFTGDPTLTGRTALWDYVRWRVADQALLGVGYGAFWDVGEAQLEEMRRFGLGFVVAQGHNGYLDVFATLGFVGLLATALVWLFAVRGSLRAVRFEASAATFLGVALMLVVGLHNASESSWLRTGHPLWVIFVLASQAVLAGLGQYMQRRRT